MEERLSQDCPQLSLEEAAIDQHSPTKGMPKKLTRAQVIRNLLETQAGQAPTAANTFWKKRKATSNAIDKRTSETAFTTFLDSECSDLAFEDNHPGHASHQLWQKGEKVKCTQCGCQWNLDGEQRIITNQSLTTVCKGAGTKGSPPLSEFFKKKSDSQGQAEADAQQPTEAHEQAVSTRPTPRRLHFPTALDERESRTTSSATDQVMTTSEEDTAADAGYEVDFF